MNKPRQRPATRLHVQAHCERRTRARSGVSCVLLVTRSSETQNQPVGLEVRREGDPWGGRKIALTTFSYVLFPWCSGIWGLDPGETASPGQAGSQRWGTTPLQAHLDIQTNQLSDLTLNSLLYQSPTGPKPPQHQAARAHPHSPSPPKWSKPSSPVPSLPSAPTVSCLFPPARAQIKAPMKAPPPLLSPPLLPGPPGCFPGPTRCGVSSCASYPWGSVPINLLHDTHVHVSCLGRPD